MITSSNSGTTISGIVNLGIHAELRGTDISSLRLDASGIEVMTNDAIHPPEAEDFVDSALQGPRVSSREPGLLAKGYFTAKPLNINGVKGIEVEADALNVPLEWLELSDGALSLGIPEHIDAGMRESMLLELRMSIITDEVLAAVMQSLSQDLAEVRGLRVDREKLTVRQLGPRGLRVEVRGRVRWKLLRATCVARTEVHINKSCVAGLRRTRVTSTNPVLAVLLWGPAPPR